MSKSAKKVLEAGYRLVENWAAGPDYNIVHLLDALREYDTPRFVAAVTRGIEALKAGGSAQQKP